MASLLVDAFAVPPAFAVVAKIVAAARKLSNTCTRTQEMEWQKFALVASVRLPFSYERCRAINFTKRRDYKIGHNWTSRRQLDAAHYIQEESNFIDWIYALLISSKRGLRSGPVPSCPSTRGNTLTQ